MKEVEREMEKKKGGTAKDERDGTREKQLTRNNKEELNEKIQASVYKRDMTFWTTFLRRSIISEWILFVLFSFLSFFLFLPDFFGIIFAPFNVSYCGGLE